MIRDPYAALAVVLRAELVAAASQIHPDMTTAPDAPPSTPRADQPHTKEVHQ